MSVPGPTHVQEHGMSVNTHRHTEGGYHNGQDIVQQIQLKGTLCQGQVLSSTFYVFKCQAGEELEMTWGNHQDNI